MIEIGKMTSKKRGRARLVKIQNALPDDPALITISKNLSDCVKKIISVKTQAMKSVATNRFLKRYMSKIFIMCVFVLVIG